ncbi:MAG TPA: tetratricopeptide repeat protein [Rhizomicrobium sp.]
MMDRLAIAVLLLGVATAPCSAMMSYGGAPAMRVSTPMKLDDYSLALRDIHHEKYADAIPHLESALQLRPQSTDIMNYLGYANRMTGNYPVSLAWYRKALAQDPDHKGAHESLGELYLTMRDIASAQGQLAELTRLCPDSCDERDTLIKSIASYQAAQPSATPAATASAAQPAANPK